MKRYCRNCYHPLSYKAKYCAHCGQKDSDGRIGMRSLIGRLWNNTFHLEGKFIRTAWQLFVPGKVTTEFFKGKQDRYPHPIRLFAIVMFLFLFLLNSMLKDKEAKDHVSFFSPKTTVKSETGDTTLTERTFSAYDQMKYNAMLYDLEKDYERLPPDWKTSQSQKTVDSLFKSFASRYGLEQGGLLDSLLQGSADSIGIGLGNLPNWYDQLLVRQGIKSYKTPEALTHAYIGSLTWTILVLIAIMSGVLALLYGRKKHYYVEHFIFLLHFHTGVMLLLLLTILGWRIGLWSKDLVFWAIFLPAPAMYFALRRYYGDGWFKTLVKWLLYGILYLFAFVLSFILGVLVVFAIF